MRTRAIGSKAKYTKGTQAAIAIASSLAKETRDSSTVDAGRTCSNRKDRKNEYDYSMSESTDSIHFI